MLPEIIGRTTAAHWKGLIADEIHSAGLLNHKTETWKSLKKFAEIVDFVYLLTGTPVRKGVIDLYAPLHLISPKEFSNYWGYVNRYCVTIPTPFGKEIQRNPRDIPSFRSMLKKYMVRRLKDEVLTQLPGKRRQIIYVEKDAAQEQIYKDLAEEMMSLYGDEVILTPNTMTMMLRLRQLLVCPKLLSSSLSYGNALETIVSMGQSLIDGEQPFVIFTPFRQALPYIAEVLKKEIKGLTAIHTVQGGMSSEEFAEQWQSFQKSRSKKKILLCVIKSGASFHATEASHAFFLGYEWDFNQNAQAEDRLCRIGQKNFVNIYYLMHKDTVDEDVAQKLNDKQDASNWIIGNEEQYNNLLRRFKINR